MKCENCRKVYQDEVEIGEDVFDAGQDKIKMVYSMCPKCCSYNELEFMIRQTKK